MATRGVYTCLLTVTLSLAASIALSRSSPPASPARSPDEQYVLGPDSQHRTDVPQGKVQAFTLRDSKTYPGYSHDWWLYIPAQYDGTQELAVMVFQDGKAFAARDGLFRVPTVLNNLIAAGQLPLMAAVFIEPGRSIELDNINGPKGPDGSPLFGNFGMHYIRSLEYDTLNGTYADFLLNDILPLVRRHVRITNNPAGRGIGGHSSGGICAFTVAWQRPDQFRKVFSANGSFTNIRGGHVYPDLVRQTERKLIRIFQQGGANDMVHPEWGNWAEANQKMAAALKEKGYDHQFVFGEGTHSHAHAASLFPDALRWLWRDYPKFVPTSSTL